MERNEVSIEIIITVWESGQNGMIAWRVFYCLIKIHASMNARHYNGTHISLNHSLSFFSLLVAIQQSSNRVKMTLFRIPIISSSTLIALCRSPANTWRAFLRHLIQDDNVYRQTCGIFFAPVVISQWNRRNSCLSVLVVRNWICEALEVDQSCRFFA